MNKKEALEVIASLINRLTLNQAEAAGANAALSVFAKDVVVKPNEPSGDKSKPEPTPST